MGFYIPEDAILQEDIPFRHDWSLGYVQWNVLFIHLIVQYPFHVSFCPLDMEKAILSAMAVTIYEKIGNAWLIKKYATVIYVRNAYIYPGFLDLGTSFGWVVSFMLRRLYCRGQGPCYSLYHV
jgi:hypothetical protein